MKSIIKKLLKLLELPIDLFFLIIVSPTAYIFLSYRKLGSKRLPKTTSLLKKIGIFPIRDHYYEPLFNDKSISYPLQNDRFLPGINFNNEFQLSFMDKLGYANELISLKLDSKNDELNSFNIFNGLFESGDAEFLYQLIRYIKPSKIIEVGSGNSTKIARLAINKNIKDTNDECEHICIEPYEQPWLEKIEGIKVYRKRIEDCELDWVNELNAGDLLFIDSSHMIRPQGDVLKIYLEIIPQLKSGVYIQVHDIFTPKDYLKSWVVNDVRFWNEQYLLEALLTNSSRYKVIAALNFLKNNYYEKFSKVCPYVEKDREPGSFYFQVKSDTES